MLKITAQNGTNYGIDWEYHYRHIPLLNEHNKEVPTRVVETKAVLYNLDHKISVVRTGRDEMGSQEVFCSPSEKYNKGKGRRKSLAKLIKAFSSQYTGAIFDNKETRKAVWEQYFSKCNDLQPKQTKVRAV